MVAVVSGSGLGLFGSSVSGLGGAGASGNAALGRGGDRAYVNTATGNLIVQSQDEVQSALGLDLALIRTYNSQGVLDDDNGDNWRLGVHQRVFMLAGTPNAAGSTIAKVFGDGREVLYTYDSSRSVYVSTEGDGAHDTLSYNTSTAQWTWTDGSARNNETYNSDGQLLASTDADGNTVSYIYTGSLLTQVTDASGQSTYLDYNGNDLTQIRVVSNGQTQTLTRYSYDTAHRLTQVQIDLSPQDNSIADNQTYTTTYTYDGASRRIASIVQSDGSSVAFTYELIDGDYRVKTYTDGEARVTTLTYTQATAGGSTPVQAPANGGVLSTTDTQSTTTEHALDSGAVSTTDTQTTTSTYNLDTAALGGIANSSPVVQTYHDDANRVIGTLHADGSLTSYEYRGSQLVSAHRHVSAPLAPLWSQDFSQDASGFVPMWPGFNTHENGALTVSTQSGVEGGWRMSFGERSYDFSDHVVYRGEVTTGNSSEGRAFNFGTENLEQSRRHSAIFVGDSLSVSYNDGGWQEAYLGTVKSDATYVVEVATHAQGSTLYVFEKGTDRESGFIHQLSFTDWGTSRSFFETFGHEEAVPASVRLDNVSEATVSGALIGSWIAAESAQDTRIYYDDAGRVSGTFQNGILTSYNYDALGQLVSLRRHDSAPILPMWSQDFSKDASGLSPLHAAFNTHENGALTVSTGDDAAAEWRITFGKRMYHFADHPVFRVEVGTGSTAAPRNFNVGAVNETSTRAHYALFRAGSVLVGYYDQGWQELTLGSIENDTTYVVEVATDAQGTTLYVYEKGTDRANGYVHQLSFTDWELARPFFETYAAPSYGESSVRLDNISVASAPGALIGSWIAVESAQDVIGPAGAYTVPAGATWQSVASTLYGVDSAEAGTALQAALGNPPLTAGSQLTGLPSTLNVTTTATVTVPAYYTIPSGATWQSIANALYGINSVAAGLALQTVLGDPPLTAGNRLTDLPATLSVTTTTTVTVPAYYTVQTNDTWASITQTIYGTSDPDAIAALQNALGNPALTAGLHLTVPLTLTYGGTGTLYQHTDVQDALGLVTTYINDSSGRLTAMLSPAVNGSRLETRYAYDADGNLTSITQDPSGLNRVMTLSYDADGNLLSTRDSAGNTVTRTFNSANQVLTETRYLVPDPDGAGAGQPGTPLTTRSVYDAEQHLRFVVSAEGRVTEHRYDAAGNRIATFVYTGGRYDVSALGATTALSESQLSTWVGTQDPTQLERTDYSYDFRGNLNSLTAYAYTDASGVGTPASASRTYFVYDQRGLLLQTVDPRGVATTADPNDYRRTYTYDGLGRVLLTTEWVSGTVSRTTSTSYDDAGNRTVVTFANGLVTTSQYDHAGELVSVINSGPGSTALGTTNYSYDLDGRLRMSTDPTGQRVHRLYDEAGRNVAQIDADGTLTEFVYGRTSQIVKTIQYAVRLNPTTLVDAGGNPLTPSLASLRAIAGTNPAADRVERAVYDNAGRLVYTVAANGALTQNFYDGASHLTAMLSYATLVTIARALDELALSDIIVPSASADDRRVRNFHDSDGKLLATLDGEGALIEREYGSAGQLVHTIAYATATPVAQRQSGTLTQLRPAADAVYDIHTRFFYDGQGRHVGTLDGEHRLNQIRYDAAGNVVEEVRYDFDITYVNGATFDSLVSLIPTTAPLRSTHYQYDGLDRLIEQTDPEGTITRNVYDMAGRLVSATRAADTTAARTTQARYDALGRVTQELTAEGSAAITGGMTQTQIDAVWTQYGVRHDYDLAGRRIATTDQNGNRTLFYYDADGRVRYTVNALGEVRESRYDTLGELTDRIDYFNAISTTGLTGGLVATNLVSLIVADTRDAHDIFTYTVTGQVATASTAEGGLVTHGYSAFGEENSRSERIDGSNSLAHSYAYDRRGLMKQTVWDVGGINQLASRDYDAFGRVTQTTDQHGLQRTMGYDRLGRIVQVRDPVRNLTLAGTTYDAFGRVLTSTDALGSATGYRYDDVARSVVVTTPENISVTTVHNRHGQTATVTDARGRVITYTYDANGRLRTAADAQGTLTDTRYDRAGLLIESRDANGVLTSMTYDAANRVLTRTVDPTGLALVTTYAYTNSGRTVTATDQRGIVTKTEYDRDGRVATVTADPSGLNIRTVYAYDARGKVLTVTEGQGSFNPRVTAYAYDKLGRRISETVDPGAGHLNLITQYVHDARDNLVTKIDAAGNLTRYAYDSENRLRYTVDALGGVTENVYDADNRITTTTRYAKAINLAGAGQSLTLAQVSALIVATPQADRVRQSIYDRDGREIFVIDGANGVTRKDYDGNGNVVRTAVYKTALPSGTYTTVQSVETALLAATDDRVANTVYDSRNLARYTVDALGGVIKNSYDADGNLIAQTAFASLRTSGQLDVATLDTWAQANANAAADRTRRSWYDAAGRIVFALDAEGHLVETRYADATRQRTEIQYAAKPTIAAGATLAQVKTAAAAVANATNDQSTRTDYDAAGRLSRTTDALGVFETYGYDAVGNRTSLVNKKGDTWTYAYDANRRLTDEYTPVESVTSVVDNEGTLQVTPETVQIRTHIEYDALGNVKRRTEAMGRSEERITSYEYDALGRQVRTIFPKLKVYSAPADDELRVGPAVVPVETEVTPDAVVTYDTLGNAAVNLDVAGNYTHKVYDKLGRLQYEVDAKNYLTEHRYDVFGNETQLIRYDAALTAGLTASAIWTEADVLAHRTVSATKDRTLITEYDRLNRATKVTQPSVFNFEPNQGVAGGAPFSGAPTASNEYNAFGQLVRQSKLLDPVSGRASSVTYYYDRRGYKSAEVSPLGYVTIYQYDETGDLTRQVEYVSALAAGSWNPTSYAAPVATTPNNAPGNAAGYDRETQFAYDRLNRKMSETRVDVEYSSVSGQTVTRNVGNQVTTFGYDALGNQTRRTEANGAVTYTYYDKLGRIIAIAEPTRDVDGSDTVTTLLTPLIEMSRDAYGNVVRERRAAGGATSVSAQTYTPAASNSADRITQTLVDRYGHALRTIDATGADRYASYTVRGELAKEWQPVTTADNVSETLVTIHEYDALGRETRVIEPQTLGATTFVVHRTAQYNAFGEITAKGSESGQEYFHYDQAGRLWRTNAGDGVDKIYLYDLKGDATAEIRSQSVDLKAAAFTDAQSVYDADAATQLRTETRYDLEGHVVERRLPVFTSTSTTEPITTPLAIGQVSGPENPVYPGVVYYKRVPYFNGPPGPEPDGYNFVVSPTTPLSQDGGWYRPITGGAFVQDPNFSLVQAVRITWDAPSVVGDPSIIVKFEYWPLGSTGGMSGIPVDVVSTGKISVNVNSLAGQTYEYRLSYQRRTDVNPYAQATGAFHVDGTSNSTIAVNPAPAESSGTVANLATTQSNGIMSWTAPTDTTVNAVLKLRVQGSSVWADLNATRSGANFTVNVQTALAQAGTYDYEIQYTRGTELIARSVGQLTSSGYREYLSVTGGRTELSVSTAVAPVSTVTGTAGATVSATINSNGTLEGRFAGGVPGPDLEFRWTGSDSIALAWGNLGSGRVKVTLDYNTESETTMGRTSPVQAATPRDKIFSSGATGGTFSWTEDGIWRSTLDPGSISQVTRVRVYTETALNSNVWTIRYDQSNPPPSSLGNSVSWAAPSDSNVAATFEIAPHGSTSYTTRSIVAAGGQMSVSLSGVVDGSYDYRITYRVGGRKTAQQTGVIALFNGSTTTSTTPTVTPNAAPAAPEAVATIGTTAAAPAATSSFVSSETINTSFVGPPGPSTIRYNWRSPPLNQVNLSWSNIGTRAIQVQLDYVSASNSHGASRVALMKTLSFPSSNSTGVNFTWTDPNTVFQEGQLPAGGISSVTRARVFGQDAAGNYTVLLRDTAGPVGTDTLVWNAPATPGITPTFKYRPVSGGTWIIKPVVMSGSQWKVDLTGIAAAQYQYYIGYQRSGETYDASFANGNFTIGTGTVTRDTQTNGSNAPAWIGNVAASGSNVTWSQASSAATVTFEYFSGGSWIARTASTSNGTNYTVNMAGVAGGTYNYRINYTNGGVAPLFQATGSVTVQVTTTVNQPTVTLSGQSSTAFSPSVITPVSIDSKTISWTKAAVPSNSTVQVRYIYNGVTTIANAVNTGGSNYSFTFPTPDTEGRYDYEYFIDYFAPNETDSYARAHGMAAVTVANVVEQPTATINSQSAAYPSGMMPIATPAVSGNLLRWTTAASAGDTIKFTYNGIELATTPFGTGYQADVSSVAAGVYSFEITYKHSGATDPYARGRGTVSIDRTVTVTSFGLTASAAPPPVTVAPRITQTVDRWGNALDVTDASDQVTHYRYNQLGQLIETKQPQVSITDTTGAVATILRDTPITRNDYDILGRLIDTRDANGRVNQVQYNAAGQVLAEIHADGGVKRSTFDVFGDRLVETDELGYTASSTYDKMDRLKTVTRQVDAAQSITESYDYDQAGRRIREINGENETTAYFYDLNGNVSRRRSALGFDTRYQYDAEGHKTQEIDAIGGTQTWTQDYFGRILTHTDLGGRHFKYDYNKAGALTWQRLTDAQGTQIAGQDIRYSYDQADQLISIDDRGTANADGGGVNRQTDYRYDAAGRRVVEKTRVDGLVHQSTAIEYDELGRISRLADLRYGLTYSYDAAGNRTETAANYYDHQSIARTQELWYVYDEMNRVEISQGVAGIHIDIGPTQGTKLAYNLRGERTSAETYGDHLVYENIQTRSDPNGPPGPDMWQNHPRYFTENGRFTEQYSYDGLGRLTATDQVEETRISIAGGPLEIDSRLERTNSRVYDKASRETNQTTRALSTDQLFQRDQINVFDDDGNIQSQTTQVAGQNESVTTFTTDHAGVQRSYTTRVYNTSTGAARYTSIYTNSIRNGESYQDKGQSVHTTGTEASQHPDGSTTRNFNVNGELVEFHDANTAGNDRFFANNQHGQALTVVQGDVSDVSAAFIEGLARSSNDARAQHFFFANGQAVGSFGQLTDENDAFEANFEVNYTPVSSRYPGAVPGMVVAQAGDTLRTMAGRVWGDAGLWYLLAEENGLTDPDAVLESGTQLKVPNRVVSLANTSWSFKPFDVSQAIGDTTPTQPAPPPPKKGGGCGVVGQILVVVVAIVVTVYTAGAASGLAASLGGNFAAGAAVLGGSAVASGTTGLGAALGAAALGGVVGSAVSQGVAMAAGIQDQFDWKAVALAGVGAGVTAGLGASGLNSTLTKSFSGLNKAAPYAATGVTAATANALTQGIAVATGLQSSFNWRDVAISAVSAPVAQAVGGGAGRAFGNSSVGAIAAQTVAGASGALVRRAFGGTVDVANALIDAFGNALGNSIVDGMQPIPTTERELTPQERRMQAGDTYEHQRRMANGEYVPPAVSLPEFNLELDNNPDFLANLPMPTAEFETDVFAGVNPFAGARLDTSIDRAVENFDRQLAAGIDAAARAPRQGASYQVAGIVPFGSVSELPNTVATIDGMPSRGGYQIVANLPIVDGEVSGVPAYYSAFDKNSGTIDYVIGQTDLPDFLKSASTYRAMAGLIADWERAPQYAKESWAAASAAMNGDWSGYFGHLGDSYAEAVTDPGWWVQMGTAAGGAVLARGAAAGQSVSVFRKMSSVEAEKTLATSRLQPQIQGTNSSKYLSESLEKVQAFQNKGVVAGTNEEILEFVLKRQGYEKLMSTSVNQVGSKGVDAVKYNFEGIGSTSTLRNIAIPSSKLDEFNQLILNIRRATGQ